MEEQAVEWLLEGDPSIRWQVLRDLLDAPPAAWQAEREHALESGWIAELLSHQGADGEWPQGRWTASTWTLHLLVALGVPRDIRPPRFQSSACSGGSCLPAPRWTARSS